MNLETLKQALANQIPYYEADFDQIKLLAERELEDSSDLPVFIRWLCVLLEKRSREFLGINPEQENLNRYEHELTRIRFMDDLIEQLLELKK